MSAFKILEGITLVAFPAGLAIGAYLFDTFILRPLVFKLHREYHGQLVEKQNEIERLSFIVQRSERIVMQHEQNQGKQKANG